MKKIIFLSIIASFALASDVLLVGAGGGYKKPVSAVIENLKKDGVSVQGAFANLGQITIQGKEGKMALIIGDEAFLDKSGIDIKGYERLGKGTLALVTLKGKTINDIKEIIKFDRIAMPDPKKAIYGIRTMEFLKNSKLDKDLELKMLAVAGVPQVTAYVLNGEVDAGFINGTEAEARRAEFGSVIYVDESLYSPVFISAARLQACDKNADCDKFINELISERSKQIFKKFGLK